jgi:hypothetical protein
MFFFYSGSGQSIRFRPVVPKSFRNSYQFLKKSGQNIRLALHIHSNFFKKGDIVVKKFLLPLLIK